MRPTYFFARNGNASPAVWAAQFAASKEMQEMQRDIAQLQDPVRDPCKAVSTRRCPPFRPYCSRLLDASNKANTAASAVRQALPSTSPAGAPKN